MADHEFGVVICLRVTEEDILLVVKGSVHRVCMTCDHRVWLSVSGQKMEAESNIKFSCMECLTVAVEKNPDLLKKTNIVPGAVEEIAAHIIGSRRPHA